MVELEDFDSTLYFLDEAEIDLSGGGAGGGVPARRSGQCPQRAVRPGGNAAERGVRDEVLGVMEQLFPNLLNSRDFRSAAAVLRESKLLKERAANCAWSRPSGSTDS